MALGGSILSYSESGSGEPVVLLDWTPWQSPELTYSLNNRYRVFSIEPPEADSTSGSIQDIAEAAVKVLDSVGIDSYTLVGTSVGADVALRITMMRPSCISSLVLVSPAGISPADSRPGHSPSEACESMLAHPEAADVALPESLRTEVLAALMERSTGETRDLESSLPELDCAALVVIGQEDRLVSRQAGHIWKERMPNCSVCYVYDTGHAIGIERPGALTSVVLDFIERRETFVVENRASIINP